MRLDDSHTVFIPPDRKARILYGWRRRTIGEAPFVAEVAPGSDAEKQGVAVGDRVLAWNEYPLKRDTLWKITVGDVRLPDGGSLERIGVTPDETVLPAAGDLAANRDPVLARAIEKLGGTITPEQAGRLFKDREARR